MNLATLSLACGSLLGAALVCITVLAVWDACREGRADDEPRHWRGRHRMPRTRRGRAAHAKAARARAAIAEAHRRASARAAGAREVVGEMTTEFHAIIRHSYDTGEIDRIRDTWAEANI